jgi:hypothetical protein
VALENDSDVWNLDGYWKNLQGPTHALEKGTETGSEHRKNHS